MDKKSIICGLISIGCAWISGALVMSGIKGIEIAKKDQRITELEFKSALQGLIVDTQQIIINHNDDNKNQNEETEK